jgi:hypothetical protein
MTRRAAALLPVALLLLLNAAAAATEWFDALVARVNDAPLLLSEVSAGELLFRSGRPLPELPPDAREAALSHAIERRLLLAEAGRFGVPPPSDQAVAEALRQADPPQNGHGWRLDRETLAAAVREHLWVEAFIDARIRAFVLIHDDAVTREVATQNGPLPGETGQEAMARVRHDLEQREAATRLARYLDRLRARVEIRRYPIDLP